MRIVGLFVFAALAVTLIMGMAVVCCADEDGCSEFCVCVCCDHSGFYIDPLTVADAAIDTASVPAEVSANLVSFPVSPGFPPPEVMAFLPV